MIIIVGMPRSGTTLVANILGQSKLVKVLIEPHIFGELIILITLMMMNIIC